MEVVKRLRDQRQNVWTQAQALAETAANENRNFTTEEQSQWDEMNSEMDALKRRIDSLLEGEKRAQAIEAKFAEVEGRPNDPSKRQSADDMNAELRSFLKGEAGRRFDVQPEGVVNFRDLTKGTTTAGGHTVPTSFYDQLVQHMIEVSGVMQTNPTVLRTAGGETIQVPKTTQHSSATSEQAEATTIPESDPVFGQEELGAYKYATLLQVSRELLDDTGVDLQGYLAMQAGRAIGNAFGARLVNGSGSGQPGGVVTRSTLGATGPVASSGGFGDQATVGQGGDLLIDLFYSVISPYRASGSCAWLMRDQTAGTVRKIKTSDGVYMWQPSIIPGTPDTILGKPVYTDPNVPATANGAKAVLFGDFSQYFVRLAGGVRFERSDDFAFDSDLVTFRAILRGDGELIDQTGALKHYAGGAAA